MVRFVASPDMTEKRVLITGGNSGIGKHTAIALAKLGASVTITARDAARGEAARDEIRQAAGSTTVELAMLDLADLASLARFLESYTAKHERLDVLVNNAGLMLDRRETTAQGIEMTIGVNHLGHFELTRGLLPWLERTGAATSEPARIVHVASDAHKAAREGIDFDDLDRERSYSAFGVYAESKLANILFSNELARRLDPNEVTSNALHPGVIRSGFAMDGDVGGLAGLAWKAMRWFMKGPEKGARTSVFLASAPEIAGESGGYYADEAPARSTRFARDDQAAARLWAWSESRLATARAQM